MSRFEYKWVGSQWGTLGVIGENPKNAVTIHHSAVLSNVNNYNPEQRAKTYSTYHKKKGNKGIAYNIMIPYDNSNIIYIVNYLNGYNWHNSNYEGNKQSLAILIDGNFEKEIPNNIQILKLKQLLDDLQDNWFQQNGWVNFETDITPKNKDAIHTYSGGISVPSLHYHNEIAQKGYSTACCGQHLILYVLEYRNKGGNVGWGTSPTTPTNPCQKEKTEIARLIELCESRLKEIERLTKDTQKLQEKFKVTEKNYKECIKRNILLFNRNKSLEDTNKKNIANIEIAKRLLNEKDKEIIKLKYKNKNWVINLLKKIFKYKK